MAMDMDKLGMKYLCPVVGKQPPDYSMGTQCCNQFSLKYIQSFTKGQANGLVWLQEAICQNIKQCQWAAADEKTHVGLEMKG